ncbi:MAG: hypothetical protein PVG27_04680 [Chloroflexota bacterium]
MDDPRLSGDWEMTHSIDEFPQPDTDVRVEIHWGELSITNDQGGWTGTWKSTYDGSRLPWEEVRLEYYELTGTGAYEGLSALLAPTGNETEASDPAYWRLPMGAPSSRVRCRPTARMASNRIPPPRLPARSVPGGAGLFSCHDTMTAPVLLAISRS